MKQNSYDFSAVTKDTQIAVGDKVILRDFTPYIPENPTEGSIPWEISPYRLLDNTPGKMLTVNHRMPFTADTDYDTIDFSTNGMPDVIEIPVPFSGKYRISIGIPGTGGIDISLNDEGFISVGHSAGGRYGRVIGVENGREYLVFWQNTVLDNDTIKLRVNFGTFGSSGLTVSAVLTSLIFERLPDDAPTAPVSDNADKDFIVVADGFSHYHEFGIPGECFDERLVRAYRDSDVRILMAQIAGGTLWDSEVTSYFGAGVSPAEYHGKRIGDVRAMKYVKDSIENKYEVFRTATEACHKNGMEMHFSIRANLYGHKESKYMSGSDYMNGRFWHEHPEYLIPWTTRLDYGKKEVRDYYLALFREVLENFDVDGISLDLTRWPPCLFMEYHTPDILINFCKDMRALADEYSEKHGKHIKVSIFCVEYYHSRRTLEEQVIDFEGICASGALDFICLETDETPKYAEIAHRHGLPFYGIVDEESSYTNNNDEDVLWALPDGSVDDDPCAGEEFKTRTLAYTAPAPFEHLIDFNRHYEGGADGIVKINEFFGSLFLRDCGHSEAVRRHVEEETLFGVTKGQYIFFTER